MVLWKHQHSDLLVHTQKKKDVPRETEGTPTHVEDVNVLQVSDGTAASADQHPVARHWQGNMEPVNTKNMLFESTDDRFRAFQVPLHL